MVDTKKQSTNTFRNGQQQGLRSSETASQPPASILQPPELQQQGLRSSETASLKPPASRATTAGAQEFAQQADQANTGGMEELLCDYHHHLSSREAMCLAIICPVEKLQYVPVYRLSSVQ